MNLFHFSPHARRIIGKIFPFGIICFIFGVIWCLVERSLLAHLDHYPATGLPYDFTTALFTTGLGSLFFGWMFGAIEILLLNKLFVRWPFGGKILIKTIIYIILLTIFLVSLGLVFQSLTKQVSPFDPEVIQTTKMFMMTFSFWSVIAYMGSIIAVMIFYSDVSDKFGQGILTNFLIGKYHEPREEQRIFMFLDIKSSTTIAEKLGHIQYYKLLNDYFADMTDAIIQSSGEIYQYVGDEIVVSWKLKNGLQDNNYLRCFFNIKELFINATQRYTSEYGLVPGFKAGFHWGKVTTGEIGVIKREIVFTGDVLNTAARIQSLCNAYEVDILISDDLTRMIKTDGEYILTEIGVCELRGKNEKVKLYTIEKF